MLYTNQNLIDNIILLSIHVISMIIITSMYSQLRQKSIINLIMYIWFNILLFYLLTPINTIIFYQSLHICISIYLSENIFKEYYIIKLNNKNKIKPEEIILYTNKNNQTIIHRNNYELMAFVRNNSVYLEDYNKYSKFVKINDDIRYMWNYNFY